MNGLQLSLTMSTVKTQNGDIEFECFMDTVEKTCHFGDVFMKAEIKQILKWVTMNDFKMPQAVSYLFTI